MGSMSMAHDKWAEKQIRVLIACGLSPQNAQAAIAFAQSRIPAAADPDTFILPPEGMMLEPSDQAVIADARNDWYQDEAIPNRFKRLLDAR